MRGKSIRIRNRIVFYLNGHRQEIGPEHAGMMLADYLRHVRRLTGTKIVCAEGDCGACSVLRRFAGNKEKRFLPINSCISWVAQLDGSSIVTVDALAEPEPTPVQQALLHCHGSQCGYCTPGIVMTLTGLVESKLGLASRSESNGRLVPSEIKNALTGNLCRCTGYQAIQEAAATVDLRACDSIEKRFFPPSQARDLKKTLASPLLIEAPSFTFFAPTSVREAAKYLARNPEAKIVAAATDLGVLFNKRKARFEKLVSLHLIPELYEIRPAGPGRLSVGARVTLARLRRHLKTRVPEFARFLDLFASPQIKNVATLVGNVGNASPIADTPPFLLVARARVRLLGPNGERSIPLEEFYLGYRKTAIKRGELIVAVDFDVPAKSERLALYKVSERKDLDISAVNAAFRATLAGSASAPKLREFALAMGGVAATPLRLRKTEAFLSGATLSPERVAQAVTVLQSEIEPISDLRASAAYRRVLVENLFLRFFRELTENKALATVAGP